MSDLNQQETEFLNLLRERPFDDTPNLEHRGALRERVLTEFDQARVTTTSVHSWTRTLNTWREIMRRPIPRLIAIAVACMAITAPWLLVPGQHSTAYGFNNFATALVDAKTARFHMEITIEGIPPQKCQAYYMAPGKFRTEMSILGAGAVSISDDLIGKIVTLMPATKTAMVMNSKGRPKDQPSNDPFFRLRDALSKGRDSKENLFKPIGEKEINGKQAVGFRSDTALGQFTLWGDPTTGHPVRVEAIWNGEKKSEQVMSDFEINVELDESLFDMTPPKDFKVQTLEMDMSKPGEQDLIAAFKSCGELNEGQFIDSLDLIAMTTFFSKAMKSRVQNLQKPSDEEMQQYMKDITPISRGLRFALELPESADAHYAGKGVKQGTADKPIFWYKPENSTKYRVINADLTVKEADAAPADSAAKRLHKANKAATGIK